MTSKMRALFLFLPLALDGQPAAHDILPAQGSRFTLDVYKTKLWEGRKHTFVFDRFNGVVSYDREHAERSAVAFTVESGSARCMAGGSVLGSADCMEKSLNCPDGSQ